MNIEYFNCKFIDRYLRISKELRSKSSYPFLINFKKNSDQHTVPIYFKQPQHWLSSCYDVELSSRDLYDKLMEEYTGNLMLNKGFKPIEIFLKYQNRILIEKRNVDLVFNNLIKFSQKSNPDTFDGKLTDKFNDLFEEEYQILQSSRSVFCIGPQEDYTGLMSWKVLNDIDITPLTSEHPFSIYKDKYGHDVLHTFHPNYWFRININLEEIVYKFIIGDM